MDMLFKAASLFLSQASLDKIQVTSANTSAQLQQLICDDQLEE